ncbi:MAG: lipopolysaccharide transport periplasmic protein LptA [Proteobacteria bacterium]|nr:lipopolysaccharide transport periplasmic protein LptA [Pseudomonadota bacterium]
MSRLLLILLLAAATAQAQTAKLSGPVDITANQLDIHHADGQATFAGNVRITQGGVTLTAPRVTVTYGKNGQGDIQQMVAEGGNVVFTRSGPVAEKATGSKAVYNPTRQELTLTGAVTLTRGPSTLAGDRLLYDIAGGNAQVTNSSGPVRAHFVPQGQ